VVVEERELDQIVPRRSRVMEVLEFVTAAEVDPVSSPRSIKTAIARTSGR
jgi:non-homologous end joining protein Ku